eukprot:9337372-Pyramimonas_sp.AAC.1
MDHVRGGASTLLFLLIGAAGVPFACCAQSNNPCQQDNTKCTSRQNLIMREHPAIILYQFLT